MPRCIDALGVDGGFLLQSINDGKNKLNIIIAMAPAALIWRSASCAESLLLARWITFPTG
jgi:hypothetical protein